MLYCFCYSVNIKLVLSCRKICQENGFSKNHSRVGGIVLSGQLHSPVAHQLPSKAEEILLGKGPKAAEGIPQKLHIG